jgi:hypothetical protein
MTKELTKEFLRSEFKTQSLQMCLIYGGIYEKSMVKENSINFKYFYFKEVVSKRKFYER